MNVPLQRAGTPPVPQGGYVSSSREMLPEFDILKIIRSLRRRMRVIIGVVVAGTLLAIVVAYQLQPVYTAQAQVLIDPQKTNVVDFSAVLSGLPPDSATVDTEVELLRSYPIAKRVAETLNLDKDPEFNSSLRKQSFLEAIDPRVWIRSLFAMPSAPLTPDEEKAAAIEAAANQILANEQVSRRGLTYVIDLSFSSLNPDSAARIANEFADTYVLSQLEAKFDATKQASEWLSSRLDELRRQLEASERAVELYRSENGLISSDGTTITEQQLSEINAQLILAKADRAEKQAKYARASQILKSGGNIESVIDVLQSTVISNLRQQEAEIARKQGDLSAKYGPRHPAILNLENERRDLESQIQDEVRRIVASISNEALVADARVKALQQSLNDLQQKTGENNQSVVRLNELERDAAANKSVYEAFLNRFKETTQQQDLQTSDARVITRATPPTGPSAPRKGLIAGVAFFFSLVGGIGLAFLLEHLDNGVQTSGQIESELGLPHLASIPWMRRESGPNGALSPQDYVVQKPLSGFSESLRSLRSALALSDVDKPPKIVLFTSALPDEGKTTTAVSFSRAAAYAGVRTVLVDCDLRHPSVHRAAGFAKVEQGLVECLAGQAALKDVLRKDDVSGFDILPVAAGAANPTDLLGSDQMRRLLAQLSDTYDLVVIDSAPVLPVADTRVLALLADKTVFIIKWNSTPIDAAISAVKDLRSFKIDLAGAVLAQVDTTKQSKYGYGDSGYYYGRYHQYYAD